MPAGMPHEVVAFWDDRLASAERCSCVEAPQRKSAFQWHDPDTPNLPLNVTVAKAAATIALIVPALDGGRHLLSMAAIY